MTSLVMRPFAGGAKEWDAQIARLPRTHLLQTWEWAQVKAAYGWEPRPHVWEPSTAGGGIGAAAMVLKKQIIKRGLAAHLSILYVPKGPLLDWEDISVRTQVLDDLQELAKREKAIFIKLDPDCVVDGGNAVDSARRTEVGGQAMITVLRQRGWVFSDEQVQFRNTVMIDLRPSEAELLRRMKPKTRYNVRLAEKKGVTVRPAALAELPNLYQMYAETSERDGFVIRNEAYYHTVWETFMRATPGDDEPAAEALIAGVEGQAVAAIFVFYFARRAYYLYGMSRAAHRDKMPNHLLQWEAIRRAKRRGCTWYDLWGAPDQFDEADPLWGVFRFKEGLGGEVVRTVGAWDYPTSSFWYPIFTRVWPRILDIMRTHGRQRVRQDLASV